MACLDTTILIDLLARGGRRVRQRARHRITQLEQEGEYRTTTRFNVVELYVGVYRSRDRDTERALVDDLCAGITILEAEAPTAMLFAQITAHLQAVGRTVGDMDVLIAAGAMVNRKRLITRNMRHFTDIPNLEVEEY